MRGEHVSSASNASISSGSPPHARGTQVSRKFRDDLLGITPACAGNTKNESVPTDRAWDHPRMRGEHSTRRRKKQREAGSPPHARGTRLDGAKQRRTVRITPACAGNTPQQIRSSKVLRDHPRMRGEHSAKEIEKHFPQGSPPHARGTQLQVIKLYLQHGITPACAGNTRSIGISAIGLWDHPRMRGEHTCRP